MAVFVVDTYLLELELKLMQTKMTQKPMLRAEGECACVGTSENQGACVAKSLTKSEALVGGAHSENA